MTEVLIEREFYFTQANDAIPSDQSMVKNANFRPGPTDVEDCQRNFLKSLEISSSVTMKMEIWFVSLSHKDSDLIDLID